VPQEPHDRVAQARGRLADVMRLPALLRLNFGVFVLHAVQLAMWVALPAMLVQAGLSKDQHWWVYLPAVLASFVVMGVTLFPLERRGYLRAVFLVAMGLIVLVQLGLLWMSFYTPMLIGLAWVLFVFFCGFNILEASHAQHGLTDGACRRAWGCAGGLQHAAVFGFFIGACGAGGCSSTAVPQAFFPAAHWLCWCGW
jgi:hypothetical protein